MKTKLLLLLASLGLCMPMFAQNQRYMCIEKSDGSVVKYNVNDVSQVYYGDYEGCPASGEVDGYEYVDLGLPSGLKWATKNVGAKDEIDYGTYYKWGEIEPAPLEEDYPQSNCKECRKTSSELMEIGVIDANINLTAGYDAATQNWSENWRMPTMAEFRELVDNCTWKWTSLCGVYGYKVASMEAGNTNWIFLPAAGYRKGTSSHFMGSSGYYWSSTVIERGNDGAYCLFFASGSDPTSYGPHRFWGLTVRPVSE